MTISIRTATSDDAAIIAKFNQGIATETEDKILLDQIIGPGVQAILNDETRGQYFVACEDDRVVGQLMITYEWSDWRNGFFWWIQSVYVDSDYRARGVFSSLYRHIQKLAKEKGNVCGIRLYVEKTNERARRTYEKLGMEVTHYDLMEEEF